jgi:hypothetical protein
MGFVGWVVFALDGADERKNYVLFKRLIVSMRHSSASMRNEQFARDSAGRSCGACVQWEASRSKEKSFKNCLNLASEIFERFAYLLNLP